MNYNYFNILNFIILLIMFLNLFNIIYLNNRFECWSNNKHITYNNSKSYDEIIPNLYIGNIDGANNLSFLKDKKITVVINCSKTIPNYFENNKYKIEYYRIPVDDSLLDEDIDLMKHFLPQYIEIINNALANNKAVFVHCYAGRQRSACIIAGYLIFKYKKTLNDAYKFIISKRKEAFHFGKSFNFHRSLLDYTIKNNS